MKERDKKDEELRRRRLEDFKELLRAKGWPVDGKIFWQFRLATWYITLWVEATSYTQLCCRTVDGGSVTSFAVVSWDNDEIKAEMNGPLSISPSFETYLAFVRDHPASYI